MSQRLFNARLYHIRTLTNLHVGNGDATFSVIDKQVQRDVLTNLPQINASSLKGALREYMTYSAFKKTEGLDSVKPITNTIFGTEPTETSNTKQGYINFHDAKLLSLPVRTNKIPFMRATSKNVLLAYIEYCHTFGIEVSITKETIRTLSEGYYCESLSDDVVAENHEWIYSKKDGNNVLIELIGENVILLKDEHFKALVKELPFVARNYLENGQSENLWYEELVPRESEFYFVLEEPCEDLLAYKVSRDKEEISKERERNQKNDKKVKDHFTTFQEELKDTQLFIGANTTVGYGLCSIVQQEVSNESESN